MKGSSIWIGRKHTEESKKKMSESSKGKTTWNKGKKCPQYSGKNHWNWKGGKIISRGYIMIYNPDHPYKDHHGYVLEHRLVMEKMLGRYLKPEEVVHHLDYDKTNNHPNNLYLFSNDMAHQQYHVILEKVVKEELLA